MSYDCMVVLVWQLLSVSIPLEQGNVLRLVMMNNVDKNDQSQSLWNRAMSYDDE